MKGPLENIVVSGVYAVAPTRYSLFSPLSPSLHLAPRALGLQAHDLRVMRSYIDVAPVIEVLDRTGVVIEKPSVSPYGVSKNRQLKISFTLF